MMRASWDRSRNMVGRVGVSVVCGSQDMANGSVIRTRIEMVHLAHPTNYFCFSNFVKKSRKIGSRWTKLTERMKCRDSSKLKV